MWVWGWVGSRTKGLVSLSRKDMVAGGPSVSKMGLDWEVECVEREMDQVGFGFRNGRITTISKSCPNFGK